LGINEWPMPGRLVSRKTYLARYQRQVHEDGVPFIPDAFERGFLFGCFVILALLVCAAVFGPFGPAERPDPALIDTVPKPDIFFLWLYAALALLPAELETPLILIAPVVGIALLLLLPFISGTGEKSWKRRPMEVLVVAVLAAGFAALLWLRPPPPWPPPMTAGRGTAFPPHLLDGRSPLKLQGALVFQNKQCRNCH